VAALVGLAVPFVGPIVYLFFRPPEYLEDVRERELEIRAIEERLRVRALECPVCRASVEASYVVCPICTTRLKQACAGCGAPLEAIWQVCPYCATHIPSAGGFGDTLEPLRPRRTAASD
jgi:predicted amidophosphoribosyltransferase